MKYITSFLIPLVLFSAFKSSTTYEITKRFYKNEYVIHTTDHEIVNLLYPRTRVNHDILMHTSGKGQFELFYALADINDNGEKTDRGFYKLENNVAYKLLDNGRDATSDEVGFMGIFDRVYIAADNGIYVYDYATNNTKKYGTINENIVKLVKVHNADLIYILAADKKVYMVTNEGTKKDEVKNLSGTTDIAFGIDGVLYYIKDSKLFAYDNGVTEITVPEGEKKLIRPPLVQEEGIFCLVGNELYEGYKNGTSKNTKTIINAKPSAYAADLALIHFYVFEKKIYEVPVYLVGGIIPSELPTGKKYTTRLN